MKKYLIMLLAVFCLVGCNKQTKKDNNIIDEPVVIDEPTDPEPIDEKIVEINLFHWNQCSHCKDEIAWLTELAERNSYIKINYYEVTEYEELVSKVRKELEIKDQAVPLTVIGSDYILGFGDSTKAKMMNMIEKYHEKDYCDLVTLIVNGEDTEDCYKQNEKK